MRIIIRKLSEIINKDQNMCRYCKNKITTRDSYNSYSDKCKKFMMRDNYILAYNARKDEIKCGQSGKYFENKYFSKNIK
jgi:hypothetical protein